DTAVADHCAACAACRQCLDEIRGDLVALPVLVAPARKRRFAWLAFALPAVAAAAIAIVVLRPKPEHGKLLAGVKGIGDVRVELVRDRAGAIAFDATTFAPGDRFKVQLTCAAAGGVFVDVAVTDAGAVDHPLGPTRIACGNDVAVPGAFAITGERPNEICVTIAANSSSEGERACVTVTPETK
ncbi:MAG TPA: hypothetical protein VH143_22940, partial [Kofleriaceae bacterium]|nr:hypothetical protein [Kofleriaceae bacterium]